LFHQVISLDNLFAAWKEFKRGKTGKREVQEFNFHLEDNIFKLHMLLKKKEWRPTAYTSFYVRDPKLRHIHKANIHDRVFNQALFRVLYQIFDKGFISDSYSCRKRKGTHRGVLQLDSYIKKITQNHTRTAYALKCDVRKFFDNISHDILLNLIRKKVKDPDVMALVSLIIKSFEVTPGVGLPLGNVTSQLFANVYLNELDQSVKHVLKAKYYLRYCDDFIILDTSKEALLVHTQKIDLFLKEILHLNLHPNKIIIRKCTQSIDFLGYVALPQYRILRTKTKRRIFKKIKYAKAELNRGLITQGRFDSIVQSYLGVLTHCSGEKVRKQILVFLKS
jgi:retron-type reverse transcriptase